MANLQSNGIPMVRNGNQVIAYMKGKEVSRFFKGKQDNASLRSWYEEDPVNNHKGMVHFWNDQKKEYKPMGLFEELLNNKSVIEVNGQEGTFTYALPIKKRRGIYTEADMSGQTFAGIEGSIFYIVLNKEFSPNTVLTYDDDRGDQIVVSGDEQVVPHGTGYKHPVTLVTQNKSAYFDASKLGRGIEYVVVSHGVAEYDTQFANVEMPDLPGSMKMEFRLGSGLGVESYVTAKADSVSLAEGVTDMKTQEYLNEIKREMEAKNYGEYAVRFDMDANNKPVPTSVNIGLTMEVLTQKYLHKLIGTKLMFQNAGEIRTTNGVLRFNEGMWKQARRGRIIEYGRPGGITKQHIREAAEHVFSARPDMIFEDRVIKFKCGMEAFLNVLNIFSEEVNAQVGNLAALLGADRILPNSPISGSDLKNLKMSPVRFTDVYIPQIGQVKIEYDPSLDYGFRGDRFERGMHGHGRAYTTHSMIISDVTDEEFSNNRTQLPAGTDLTEGGNLNSNLYIVKPQNTPFIYSGRTNGRYDSNKSSDILAANPYMGTQYWAWTAGVDCWMPDPSKFVLIELKPSAQKGYK